MNLSKLYVNIDVVTKKGENYEKRYKRQIRSEIIEKLKNVPEGQRVKVEKTVLENLLFETVAIDDGQLKLPVWSGDFLKKN